MHRMLNRMTSLTKLLMTAAIMCSILCSSDEQSCPLAQHLSPCTCTERDSGLDVSCTNVSTMYLKEIMDVLELSRRTVWFLRITNVQFAKFPRFEELELRNLVLVQSSFDSLEEDAFSGKATQIQSLDLSKNCLKKIPSQAMSTLKSLASLKLDYNCLETLEAHAFSDLVSLLWLSLYGNRIRLIDSRAYLGTEASLTRLNLGGNRLGQVPRYAIQRLKCLQGLRLHDNNISEILVENLPSSLFALDLSGNDIEFLEAESFATLRHLSVLDLEDNKIKAIHEHAFKGIQNSLEWLKLGGNLLTSIPYSALRNMTGLRHLDLRHNNIPRVEAHAFHFYGKTLKFIFLQKNSIQRIEEGALDVLESIEWLYLHSNILRELRFDTFRSIIDSLHVLDLHDNPYHCDCDILWFRDWLHSKGQNVTNLPKETRCNTTRHAQKPIVKLSNNSFQCSKIGRHLTNGIEIMILLSILLNYVSLLLS